LGTSVRKMIDGRAACLEASVEQAHSIKDRDPNLPLTVLVPDSDPARTPQAGLRIILRGTTQLKGFPLAAEAFQHAAARWEAVIQSQITAVIDIDFGPTLFGRAFDDNVIGTTDAQVLGGNSLYPAVRSCLISEAYAPENGEDAGGGMRGGKQGKIFEAGNAYLDREFLNLDHLVRATIVKP
jgi:hypothetical protein